MVADGESRWFPFAKTVVPELGKKRSHHARISSDGHRDADCDDEGDRAARFEHRLSIALPQSCSIDFSIYALGSSAASIAVLRRVWAPLLTASPSVCSKAHLIKCHCDPS